jgi:tellurite resistance protein
MGIFSLKSHTQKEKETTVKNAIAVMLADGHIDPREMNLLSLICRTVGLSERTLQAILQNPQSIEFAPAKNLNDRMQQLIDIVTMMLADGRIDPSEMDVCITLATRLGFRPSSVGALVQHIINEISQNRGARQVNIDVNAYL